MRFAAYDEALIRDSDNAEIYHLKGEALFQLQLYQAALTVQDEAIRDRLNARFLSGRAQSLVRLGRFNEALGVFNRIQAVEPDNLLLWQDKFLVLSALNRPEEAERVRREISNKYVEKMQQQPQDASIFIAQGDFFGSSQMFVRAAEAYQRASELEPDSYSAWMGLGLALTQQEEYEAAQIALGRALQIRPQSYRAIAAFGNLEQLQNNFEDAIANYDRALEINSQDPAIWRERGIALKQQGKYTQAIESLNKARQLTNYDLQTWLQLGQTRAALEQDELAISAIRAGTRILSTKFRTVELERINSNTKCSIQRSLRYLSTRAQGKCRICGYPQRHEPVRMSNELNRT